MKYTYELDSLKRFKYLKPAEDGDTPIIEIPKEQFRNVICGFHGLVSGQIREIGFTTSEKQEKESHSIVHRIEELKELLLNSDWKVIVNAELVQAGLPPKYPNLHLERQAWRDEINKLEVKL